MNRLWPLLSDSFANPRKAARDILAYELKREYALMALALVVTLSVLLTFGLTGGEAIQLTADSPGLLPLTMALLMMSLTTLMGFMLYFAGQAMQGRGSLAESIVVMAWIQALFLAAQIVQAVLLVFSPPLAGLAGFGLTLYILWIFLNFIDELHQLGSLARAAMLLILAFVGVVLGMSVIVTLIGINTL